MTRKGWLVLVVLPAVVLLGATVLTVLLARNFPSRATGPAERNALKLKALAHLPMPRLVKGIYLTAFTAASRKRYEALLDLADRTELNAFVVDLKGEDGRLAFVPETESLKAVSSTPYLPRLEDFTAELHRHGLYAIARIFVFQDPDFAENSAWGLHRADGRLWGDRKGVRWTDPAAEGVWAYNRDIAREAWARGFDEVQFDYIRFPTDGDVEDIIYPVWDGIEPKRQVIGRFFRYLNAELVAKGIPVSVDLFGYTVRLDEDDLGIGQHAKDALPFVTAVSPMVYPSHYYAGSYGFARPADHPGEIVTRSMEIARQLMASSTPDHGSIRPWLQDFDIGADYDAAKVRAEIDAAEQGGASGWLLWNARNVYTEEALKREATSTP